MTAPRKGSGTIGIRRSRGITTLSGAAVTCAAMDARRLALRSRLTSQSMSLITLSSIAAHQRTLRANVPQTNGDAERLGTARRARRQRQRKRANEASFAPVALL